MIQGAVAGLAVGAVYAITAVMLTLTSRLVRVINFSQAAVGMFGAFLCAFLVTKHVPLPVALLIGLATGVVLSLLIGLIMAAWFTSASISVRSAVTVAALLLLIAASFLTFGTRPMTFTSIVSGQAFEIGGVGVSRVALVLVVATIVLVVAFALLLRFTTAGTRLRAIADRPLTAELIGIPVHRLSLFVWGLSGLLATAMTLVVAPSQTADATSLALLVIPGAAAALVGGFSRPALAAVGGVLLGVVQGVIAQFSELALLRDWLPLLLIVALLLWTQRKEVWDVAR